MKTTFLLPALLLLLTLPATAQTGMIKVKKSASKQILVHYSNDKKVKNQKAIRIHGDTVDIELSQKYTGDHFRKIRSESVNNDPVYQTVLNLSADQVALMAFDLGEIGPRYFKIYTLILPGKDGIGQIYKLKRLPGRYPPSCKEIMEALDKYFEKLK